MKDEMRSFFLDLLRYMRIAGFEPTRTRANFQQAFSKRENGNNHRKFSLQFFDRFLDYLSMPKLEVDFYLKVLFPVLTSHLQKFRGYFLPCTDMQVSSTTASVEEKMKIMK